MLSVLMLTGSTTTPALEDLSLLYAGGALRALAGHARLTTLHRSPDRTFRLVSHGPGDELNDEALAAAMPMDLAAAVGTVSAMSFDLALPQMFCPGGMTHMRALLDLLDIPYIGNRPNAMAITADKSLARALVASAGVAVPPGERVAKGGRPVLDLELPVVVKPAASDNSDGLSLVRRAQDLAPALARAFIHGDALVERFIPPGRELRCAVIERDGELIVLPAEEYPVGADHPVRTSSDKLRRDDGELVLAAKTKEAAWIVADDDPVLPALHDASLRAFRALGCRHYGLFDFRVDEAGKAWFLEAGLYCSFSAQSVVCVMAEAAGITVPELFDGFAQDLLAHSSFTSVHPPPTAQFSHASIPFRKTAT